MLMLPSGDSQEEKNKSLRLENEELKQQLRDAFGDMKVIHILINFFNLCALIFLQALRTQISILKSSPINKHVSGVFPAHQKEEMVQQLEAMHIKVCVFLNCVIFN